MKKACVFLVVILLLVSCSKQREFSAPIVEAESVVVPVQWLKDMEPSFYTVNLKGRRVNFFVIKIGQKVESYLDACMKCYPHKMGYKVDGFYLVCRYCGVRYPVDALSTGFGSCYPIPLRGTLKADRYIISKVTLEEATRYF